MWHLNITFAPRLQTKEEVEGRFKYFALNKNKTRTYQNVRDAVTTVLRRKHVAVHSNTGVGGGESEINKVCSTVR